MLLCRDIFSMYAGNVCVCVCVTIMEVNEKGKNNGCSMCITEILNTFALSELNGTYVSATKQQVALHVVY